MTTAASDDQAERRFRWWMLFLPVEQAVVIGLACLAAPGVWAVFLLSQRRLVVGATLLCAWMVGLAAAAIWAYRRCARPWVTGGLVAAVLIVGVAALAMNLAG